MNEYEINTFKIDFEALTTIEEVDMWLDKLSRAINGYVQDMTGKEKRTHLTARAEARVWQFVDPLLDKRLELMNIEVTNDRSVRLCN